MYCNFSLSYFELSVVNTFAIAEDLKQIKFVVKEKAGQLFDKYDEDEDGLLDLAEVSGSNFWL